MPKLALPRDYTQPLGIALFASALVIFVGPRAATGVYAGLALCTVAQLALDSQARAHLRACSLAAWMLLAFAAWSLVTAAWAPEPAKTAGKAMFLGIIILAAQVVLAQMRETATPTLRRLATAALLGIGVGYLATAFEILSNQYLTRTVLTLFPALQTGIAKHLIFENGALSDVGEVGINRRLALLTLLLWPALVLACTQSRSLRLAGITVAIAGATATLLAGTHQSSQVAILTSAAVFGLARVSYRWTLRLVAAAWCLSVVLMVPAGTAAYRAELHNASWLPYSARHRVVIWGYTADQVLRNGVLGVGADGTAAVHERRRAQGKEISRDHGFELDTGRHAHNAYLQVWYELGIPGALLFLAAGLALLRAISSLPARAQPFALAQFACAAAMLAFSFSIWQTWFQAAIGLSVITLLGGAILRDRPASELSRPGLLARTAINPAE